VSKSVTVSIATNSLITGSKLFGFLSTGSPTLFAETIHSATDAINQVLALRISNALLVACLYVIGFLWVGMWGARPVLADRGRSGADRHSTGWIGRGTS
jgi:hypothetical protein